MAIPINNIKSREELVEYLYTCEDAPILNLDFDDVIGEVATAPEAPDIKFDARQELIKACGRSFRKWERNMYEQKEVIKSKQKVTEIKE